MGRLADFVVQNALWIFIGLIVLVGGFIYFSLRGVASEDPPPAPPERRPPFRPPGAEEEGPRRVLATPGGSPAPAKHGDTEYALVVNEEDLKMPPLPEDAASTRRKVDSGPIQELLSRRDYDGAYKQYLSHLEADRKSSFAPEVERRLGEHFLRSGDLEKAARVLEHHVATQPGDKIEPRIYFDLGYIHFKAKTLKKSRRYFRLFVERHRDPAEVDRARKILARLEKVQNLN